MEILVVAVRIFLIQSGSTGGLQFSGKKVG